MSTIDINELERALADGPAEPGRPDLASIHRLGRRRRRIRSALAGGMAALVLAGGVGGGAILLGGDGGSTARDAVVAGGPPATSLSPLAERALAEIPGAQKVNSGEVVIPAPEDKLFFAQRIQVEGEPVELPRHYYYGVTSYRPAAWPAWLYEGTEQAEVAAADADGSYAVGTRSVTGVYVDAGERYLACALPRDAWDPEPGAPCFPAIVTEHSDGGYIYEYGLGTDEFLSSGAPMEVFVEESYVSGELASLAVAGIDGTDVARAEFVSVDGTRVEGRVEAGTLMTEESFFFAEVPDELARVVIYDEAGTVIEDHKVTDCDSPVECEVR